MLFSLLQLSYYMSMVPETRVGYKDAGPSGQALFNAGVAGFEGSFRGLNVVRSMPFETTDETDAVQMLQRQTQVGEFYYVGAPESPPYDTTKKTVFDTVLFDEDKDQLVKITALETLEHLVAMLSAEAAGPNQDLLMMMLGLRPYDQALLTPIVGNDGRTTSFLNGVDNDPFGFQVNKRAFTQHDTKINKQDTDLGGGAIRTNAGTNVAVADFDKNAAGGGWTLDKIKVWIDRGLWFPFRMMILRPFIEHLTLSAIAGVAGSDTGATLFGPSGKTDHRPHNPRNPLCFFSLGFPLTTLAPVACRYATFGALIKIRT